MSATTSSKIALLAPVPLEHLKSGQVVCAAEGHVAFGSRAWEVFDLLDQKRDGLDVDAYIYPSDAGPLTIPKVTWCARYTGFVKSDHGAHPERMRFRPLSTEKYEGDNTGHWAIFWEVTDLRELSETEHIKTGVLQGFQKPKPYKNHFVPEGPILIEHPAQ